MRRMLYSAARTWLHVVPLVLPDVLAQRCYISGLRRAAPRERPSAEIYSVSMPTPQTSPLRLLQG